jgi:hypothetical protein
VDDDTVLNTNELSRKHKGIGNMNKTTSSESEAENMKRAIALNLTSRARGTEASEAEERPCDIQRNNNSPREGSANTDVEKVQE